MFSSQHTAYSHSSRKASCLSFSCSQGVSPPCTSLERNLLMKLSCLIHNALAPLRSVRLGWGLCTFQPAAGSTLGSAIWGARGRLQGSGGRRDLLRALGLLFLPASLHLGSCWLQSLAFGELPGVALLCPSEARHQQAVLLSPTSESQLRRSRPWATRRESTAPQN